MGRRKTVSLKSWHNEATSLTADAVARIFALGNLEGSTLELALQVLDVFKSDPKRAKSVAATLPRHAFVSSTQYLRWAQFLALLTKSGCGGDDKSRRRNATSAFYRAEAACQRANRRLRWFAARPDRENPVYRVILSRAKELISRVLGTFTEHTLEQILIEARPGGGAALGTLDRCRTSLPFKLGEQPLTVTPEALPYAMRMVETSQAWLPLVADIDWEAQTYTVPYEKTAANRIGFVPKDATTMRTIAVEPHLNMCLQLGVHEYVTRRLRSFGIDLSSQSRNQELARKGALFWQSVDPIVTLDLSAASDSVSRGLVERLLPTTWREFLDDLRCKHYELEGETREYQKWSSMGNGYTFVLETLLFWAIGRACLTFVDGSDDTIAVYGDDIAIRRNAALLLIEVLRYCGFSINTDKSFVFGPFRESCGEDYWESTRVVPVYLRGTVRLRPTDIYRLVNRLKSLDVVSSGVERACFLAHSDRPILYGLEGTSDTGCWWTSLEDLRVRGYVHWRSDQQAWEQREAEFRPYKGRIPSLWGLAAALRGARGNTHLKWAEAKAAHRVRGQWGLVRRCVG